MEEPMRGGGGLTKSVIVVTAPTGSTVTCTGGSTTKTAQEKSGTWTFSGLDNGTWTITATKDGQTATKSVSITRLSVIYVTMNYRSTPEFTYTGTYQTVDDNDNVISDFASYTGNWKIRFLTSGDLTPVNLHGFDGYVDIFMAAAGAGGGTANTGGGAGSGHTKTIKHVLLSVGVSYHIDIGAGGKPGTNGGNTSISGSNISKTVSGGTTAKNTTLNGAYSDGGDGASGGAAGWTGTETPGTPGSDGSDGTNGSYYKGGKGQGTTTKEFAEVDGKLYCTGGDASRAGNTHAGEENTGDGGGAQKKGGSGIVIIRNKR